METTMKKTSIKGGEFLIRETLPQDVFIREELSEEQVAMAQACQDFLDTVVYPKIKESEADQSYSGHFLEKAGELGLLGVSIPEEYGGLGMNFVTSLLMADVIGSAGSFSTTFGAHTGIGTLPILYYGTEAQKQKYVPNLGAGIWKACYCLTEPTAGSDANGGKSTAILTEDGKYYKINGQKMWITNSGYADIFIVFAKIIDPVTGVKDENLSAFIVEKGFGGITLNEEEHKMGIKGSSTRQVFFNDCMVPVENLLYERGKGFKIAVNILNIGRIKLAAGVLGGCKMVTTFGTKYTTERHQFDKPLSSFGAIKHKLAQMATLIYATEAAIYRAGQDIDDHINKLISEGVNETEAKLRGLEEFAIECAMMKVHSSEVLQYVTDEGVQLYGGMGFSADAPMERAYRDARIARIYEGTNEINRMLAVGTMAKRAMSGKLDLMTPGAQITQELMGPPSFDMPGSELFDMEKWLINNLKKAVLMVAGQSAMVFGPKLNEEQEILMNAADMLIEVYVAESVLLRTAKLVAQRGEAACAAQIAMTKVYIEHAVDIIEKNGKTAINSFAYGDMQRIMSMGLKRYCKIPQSYNTKELRRQIADIMIEGEGYIF